MATEPPVIEAPRAPYLGRRGGTPDDRTWWFMRASGVLLVVLVVGHLFVMTVLDSGVQRINFGFVAARWATPFWQVWDLLMLWLALLHGALGVRPMIDEYARRDIVRVLLAFVLYTATVVAIALGTLVIVTFDSGL